MTALGKTCALGAGVLTRRALLGGGLAATATAVVPGCGDGRDAGPVKVGVLHSLTGTVAIAEAPIKDATLFAIDEINAAGGVLGRRIEPVVVDGRSDWPTFAAATERLIAADRVAVIFGCYTSASRRTVIPVVERHNALLFYPTLYEGLERSNNVIYTGPTPNQFITPAIRWFFDNRGKSFFLVGSDYVFPQASNAVIKAQLDLLGGRIAGEEYLVLGNTQVGPVIQKILHAKPEVIVSTVVGDTNIPFFRQLRAAGVTPRTIPTVCMVLGENELAQLDAAQMAGDYVAMTYFQTIQTPENERFVRAFKQRYGQGRPIADPMEAAYVAVNFWAQAVRKADSVEADAVRAAVRGQRFQAPSGTVYVDEENLHTWKSARIGQIQPDGQIKIVWTSEVPIHPVPYAVYRTRQQWDDMLHDLYVSWGNSWAKP